MRLRKRKRRRSGLLVIYCVLSIVFLRLIIFFRYTYDLIRALLFVSVDDSWRGYVFGSVGV